MRILWVKAGGLVPPDTGGKIRSYNILCELARRHSVTIFSFHGAHANDQHPSLGEVFERVVSVPLALPAPKSSAELLHYGVRLFSPQPYGVTKFCTHEARNKLREVLSQNSYDVIVCDFIHPAGVIPWDSPIPKVIFTHNVEAVIWKRHYEVAKNPAWRAISWWEWRKMKAAEQRYLRLADRVLTVSETDRDSFARLLPEKTITVIPTGVDIEYFKPTPTEELPNSLVFTGSMDWLPNEDAILYVAEAILPLLKAQCPDISLEVVGRNPSSRLGALAEKDKSIRLTGWVEDIRPFLARGSVCIVPLRIGGGTRLKIFEAMAMGKATVSTSIGAEGLPVKHGENILLADTPGEFADAVLGLFRDGNQRRRLAIAARTLVEENYSWDKIAEDFSRLLHEVIDASKNAH